ncbi:hypothetical protein Uis1B_2175 [Bifidobacterium margollesii]|uniref:Uncharacterized protein n=1 Tax=Bifidobacterium margollesii TaxID=2020964 RepID=A0A2N5J717_9BIFI|nr:hypothetical protein [Bifidobacterium margollesii]PLS29993.1 hypothetical protein Uis1B_2175 [Bifidobacterium margollesii]
MQPRMITTGGQLARLAERITDPDRRNTIVVLSVTYADGRPRFDPDDIARAVDGTDTDVCLLAEAAMGGRLSRLTGGAMCAYDGAASIIPAYGRARTVIRRDESSMDYLLEQTLIHSSFTRPKRSGADETRPARTRRAKPGPAKPPRRRDAAGGAAAGPDPSAWPDDMLDDWLRLAVAVAWADGTDPATKRRHPLPGSWDIAPGLGRTIARRADRTSMLRRMAAILDGLDTTAHPVREGRVGPNRRGRWGGLVWRAYAKQGSPAAGRIHYTRDTDGRVVFLESGGHDDMI